MCIVTSDYGVGFDGEVYWNFGNDLARIIVMLIIVHHLLLIMARITA